MRWCKPWQLTISEQTRPAPWWRPWRLNACTLTPAIGARTSREGISTSRIYLQEGRSSVGAILVEMITGVQSAFTYVGAQNPAEFHAKAVVGVQDMAGFAEGLPRPESRGSTR